MGLRKSYVLDTSVLLATGRQALTAFDGGDVIIPLVVIKELEKKRTDPILGFIARDVLRAIEDLRVEHGFALKTGVQLDGIDSTLRIEVNHVDRSNLPVSLRDASNDTSILAVAYNLAQDKDTNGRVVLVSNDLPLRVKAQLGVGLDTTEFLRPELNQGDFLGVVNAEIDLDAFQEFSSSSNAVIGYDQVAEWGDEKEAVDAARLGVHVTCGKSSFLGLARKATGTITRINPDISAGNIRGRSLEQRIALNYLMDPELSVLSLGGRAGTGKTLLALAAGVDQTMKNAYDKVVVFRSLYAVDNQSLGYLPGTEEEKMAPWAAAVYDALDAMGNKNIVEHITHGKLLEVLPVTHIRGRTLTNTFIIIDEAQNLERNILLSLLSRVGDGTKVVLSWDAAQRDNLNISRSDGITALVNRLKRQDEFAHVTLTRSERSKVAEMASSILEEMSGS